MKTKTFYASPEKKNLTKTTLQRQNFIEKTELRHCLDSFSDLTAVVNEERQIIYANKALLSFIQASSGDDICGERPGELFNCLHASDTADGCGASTHCQFCGASQAIQETLATKQMNQKECTLKARIDGKEKYFNFLVTATPFIIEETSYILLNFKDVGLEKQKLALERIFFHDILNTISSLQVHIELLKRSPEKDGKGLVSKIEAISHTLIDEINSQKMLISAENKTLIVQNNLIMSNQLTQEVIDHLNDHEVARLKKITVAPFSEVVAFISDATIIRRVLFNMLKNALEASPPGATVTVGHVKEETELHFWVHNPTYMEKEIQLQIFNRYFSTKGINRGLGTYSMKLLTEEYLQGSLFFKTYPEKGTTFHLIVPLKQFTH